MHWSKSRCTGLWKRSHRPLRAHTRGRWGKHDNVGHDGQSDWCLHGETAVNARKERSLRYCVSAERYHRVILVLTILAQFVAPLVIFSFGALVPLMRASLHVSREQIGLLTTLYFASSVLASILVGWLTDRYGVRVFLSAMQGLGGLPLMALALLPTYRALLLVMPLAGIAHGAVFVLTTKALYEWFPRERRATVIGVKQAAVAIAGMVAGIAMPLLALRVSWSSAFAGLGGLLVASALCHLLLYRNRPQEAASVVPLPVATRRHALWRDPHFGRLVAVGFLFHGVQNAFTVYLTLFLREHWGVPLV